jgi:thymidylate kinase
LNIIFEGIDGVGKTTLISKVIEQLAKDGYLTNNISELENTPLRSLLDNLLKEDIFFKTNKTFKTSIYETFLLSAHFFYKQEYFRNDSNKINFYDRDIFTLLCYQKQMIKLEYGEQANAFWGYLKSCLMFDLKNIDLLVYVSVPVSLSFDRIEKRDNISLTQSQKDFLVDTKECFEELIKSVSQEKDIPVLLIDGSKDLKSNIQIISEKIKCTN